MSLSNIKEVYHRISIPGRASRYSAWFDGAGFLRDCERIDSIGRSFPCTAREMEALKKGGWSAKQHHTFNA